MIGSSGALDYRSRLGAPQLPGLDQARAACLPTAARLAGDLPCTDGDGQPPAGMDRWQIDESARGRAAAPCCHTLRRALPGLADGGLDGEGAMQTNRALLCRPRQVAVVVAAGPWPA
ncbi:MAG: hypothetical protein AcusKO_47010 [Acuticoccus sp.]